ncbi:hypothetical protein O181_101448 [Austropuccinia psidii MF-1]|uniref:Uncharacterized protein n=1 Tax=Austropuccinia psidii MF-1 TaxID=1389203 RepID=A0A9Q3JGK3_9BASI|nr:hypothetical protein [Austropuccinia psidii MF-1]
MASTAHGPYFLDLKLCAAGHGPWSVGLLGPFWPKYNEAKRGQGGQPPATKDRCWPPHPTFPKLAKRTPGNTFWPLSTPGLWKPPEATSLSPEIFTLHSGEGLSFTKVLCTNDSGMVHIWYNIPLCTNFPQK